MISFKHRGNFGATYKFLNKTNDNITTILHKYGKEGVDALSAATPSDSGLTSISWYYTIKSSKSSFSISWSNSNVVDGIPIVILIQYGHGTRTGGYIQPQDFINPTMQPIFDRLREEIWKEVRRI